MKKLNNNKYLFYLAIINIYIYIFLFTSKTSLVADDYNYMYILDGGISEQNKKRLDEICFTYGRGLPIWIQAVNIQEIIG